MEQFADAGSAGNFRHFGKVLERAVPIADQSVDLNLASGDDWTIHRVT